MLAFAFYLAEKVHVVILLLDPLPPLVLVKGGPLRGGEGRGEGPHLVVELLREGGEGVRVGEQPGHGILVVDKVEEVLGDAVDLAEGPEVGVADHGGAEGDAGDVPAVVGARVPPPLDLEHEDDGDDGGDGAAQRVAAHHDVPAPVALVVEDLVGGEPPGPEQEAGVEAAADDLHDGAALLLKRLEVVLPVVRACRSPERHVNPENMMTIF